MGREWNLPVLDSGGWSQPCLGAEHPVSLQEDNKWVGSSPSALSGSWGVQSWWWLFTLHSGRMGTCCFRMGRPQLPCQGPAVLMAPGSGCGLGRNLALLPPSADVCPRGPSQSQIWLLVLETGGRFHPEGAPLWSSCPAAEPLLGLPGSYRVFSD